MTLTASGEATTPRRGLRWTLIGRLTMTAANAALMLVAALVFFDDETFGRFAVVVAAQLLLSRAVLAGLDQGVVRLYTAERAPDQVVRAALWITGSLGLIAILGGAVMALTGPRLTLDPSLAFAIGLGAAGSAWFDLGCSIRLARVDYRAAGLWMAAMPIARMALTIVACVIARDSLLPFVTFPLVTLLGGLTLLIDAARRHGLHLDPSFAMRVLRYSWWIGLGDAAAVLGMQSGLFMLTGVGMHAEAGRYGFALQIAQGFFAVFVAFYQALLPKASRLSSAAALRRFLGATWRTAWILVFAMIATAAVVTLAAPPIVTVIRPELADFVPGFVGLTAFVAVLILEAPLGVACQYLLRPRLHVATLWLRCAAIAVLGLWLVPAQGELGAGVAQAGGAVVAALTLGLLVFAAIERRRREEVTACAAS